MADILRTGVNNYFINEDGSISMQYDPYFNKCIMKYCGDSPKIKIPMDKISIQPGGQIIFKFNNQKYVIDDGYRNKLIMAGYLVLNSDSEDQNLKTAMIEAFKGTRFSNTEYTPNSLTMKSSTGGYNIELIIETINKMVDRNIKRSELKLPMYPTERGYSKQSSLYFRIYAQKDSTAKVSKSVQELHSICNRMIKVIAGSNHINWEPVIDVTKDRDTKYKYSIKECKVTKTTLKWEEDL